MGSFAGKIKNDLEGRGVNIWRGLDETLCFSHRRQDTVFMPHRQAAACAVVVSSPVHSELPDSPKIWESVVEEGKWIVCFGAGKTL